MTKYKLIVEYVGTSYNGWQKQDKENGKSIQESIENAVYKFCNEKVVAYSAGRTDAGVHAIAMPVHIETVGDYCHYKMLMALNFYLKNNGDEISVLSISRQPNDFHARFSCVARHYVYKVFNRSTRSVIYDNRMWWIYKNLNVEAMDDVAKVLIGKFDFSTFRAAGCQAGSPVKTLSDVVVQKVQDNEIDFYFSAPSFLYHQVRNIVGSLILVGKGKWSREDFLNAFKSCDRTKGGPTAPAHGLYFLSADY